jgi:hypothetical protein
MVVAAAAWAAWAAWVATITKMGTLGGFPNPPALWLRWAKPTYAYADR